MLIPCWWVSFSDRICPGKDIAENTMWICIASIFYAFKITPELDKDGNPLPVDLEYEEFSVRYGGPLPCYCFLSFADCHWLLLPVRNSRHPKPFKTIIKPRHESTVDLIRSARDA